MENKTRQFGIVNSSFVGGTAFVDDRKFNGREKNKRAKLE